jgi:hypothetical protein
MKNILLSLVALCVATSAFAADPIFGPAKPPVKEGTGTFHAKSYGVEVKSVNDVKFVGIYDNKNGNGAVQKTLQSFSFQGLKFYTTATLSTNKNVDKAYAGASAMVEFGPVDQVFQLLLVLLYVALNCNVVSMLTILTTQQLLWLLIL